MSGTQMTPFQYEGNNLRWGGTKDEPWFVAQDVCEVLGVKNSRQALATLADDEKGVREVYTLGGTQKMAVVYESGLYRLIMRSNKDEAEKFRRWVFHDVLPTIRKTGEYRAKRRDKYAKLGHGPEWVETREQGVEVRKTFTDTLKDHGVKERRHYAWCTDAIYVPILGGKAQDVKRKRQLPVKSNLRDNLPTLEVLAVSLSEKLAQEKIDKENAQGFQPCYNAASESAKAIARAIDSTRQIEKK